MSRRRPHRGRPRSPARRRRKPPPHSLGVAGAQAPDRPPRRMGVTRRRGIIPRPPTAAALRPRPFRRLRCGVEHFEGTGHNARPVKPTSERRGEVLRTLRIDSPEDTHASTVNRGDCGLGGPTASRNASSRAGEGGTASPAPAPAAGATIAPTREGDPATADLVELMNAWATLPAATRAAVMALVKTTHQREANPIKIQPWYPSPS